MNIFHSVSFRKAVFLKIFVGVLSFVILGYGLLQLSKSRTFQFFGVITNRVNTQEKVVALTFDDAPTENTSAIMKTLEEKNIKATFYLVGSAMEKYPEIARKIVQSGNEIGNHSYSHERLILKSPKFIESEITRTNQLIRSAGFAGEITFRPPNGKKLLLLPWYLAQNKIKTIMWDVEPDTYYRGNSNLIIKNTLASVQPGSIILMHPFCNLQCAADREALPEIIDELIAKGYKFITISELLSL